MIQRASFIADRGSYCMKSYLYMGKPRQSIPLCGSHSRGRPHLRHFSKNSRFGTRQKIETPPTLLRQETNVITFKQGQQSRCGLHQHPKQYKCSAGKHRRESKILYRDQLCPKGRLLPKANTPPVSSSSEAAPARQVSSSSSNTGPRLNEAGRILTSFPPT